MNAERIIEKLGGTAKVAELCQVTTQAVSQWKAGIPKARLMYLMAVRPDVFEGEDGLPRPSPAIPHQQTQDRGAPRQRDDAPNDAPRNVAMTTGATATDAAEVVNG